jgi:enamine deaminase RidA (YjgF/YER057c/UK114 family)
MTIERHSPYGGVLHEVVEYKGLLHFGGIVAEDLGLDMAGQTRDVLEQLDALLKRCGSDRSHVLSTQLFVTDLSLRPAMNEVWTGFFAPDDMPARATVADLGPGVLLEMTAVAAKA